MHQKIRQLGSTLIELVMAIAAIGVLGVVASIFIRAPIDSYFASARRAALTDEADTAVRRMARDIRKALPNSIRTSWLNISSNGQCFEFIPTRTGGRYRAELSSLGEGDTLDFVAADGSFNMLGDNGALPANQQTQVNDVVAVYNLGISGDDAYVGDNTSQVSQVSQVSSVNGGPETNLSIASKLFPQALGGKRFHVIPGDENVVAYVCSSDGKLRRTVRTFTNAVCPATGPILASHVGSCNFVYSGSDLERNEPIQLSLTLTDSGETVNLYQQIYVNNTPINSIRWN